MEERGDSGTRHDSNLNTLEKYTNLNTLEKLLWEHTPIDTIIAGRDGQVFSLM